MTHEKILEYCLTKKGAYEDCPFGDGTVCVKVKKRIFAQLFHLKGVPMLTFNGDAMTGDFYRTAYPNSVTRGYHCPPSAAALFQHGKAGRGRFRRGNSAHDRRVLQVRCGEAGKESAEGAGGRVGGGR